MRLVTVLLMLCPLAAQAQNLVPIDWSGKSIDQVLPGRGYSLVSEGGKSYWYSAPGNPRALTSDEWKSLGYEPEKTASNETTWRLVCGSGS